MQSYSAQTVGVKKKVNILRLKKMGGKKITDGPDWRSGSHVDNCNRLDFSWCLRVDLNTPLCVGVKWRLWRCQCRPADGLGALRH